MEGVGRLPSTWDYQEGRGGRAIVATTTADRSCLVVLYPTPVDGDVSPVEASARDLERNR